MTRMDTNEEKSSADKSLPIEPAGISKVDDHTHPQTRSPQVIKHLRFFAASDLLHRLQFHQDRAKANQVREVFLLQALPFVVDAKLLLRLEAYPAPFQFEFHDFLVDRLQKPAPEFIVY